MRAIRLFVGTAVLGFALAGSLAAQQAAAPKDATGQCTDGSYTTAKTQAKGCLKHGGVKTWFGSATAATEAPAPKSGASVPARASAPTSTSASTRSQPKDATGQCADGSYTTAKTQAKGCLKHGGVKTWYGTSAAATSASAAPAQAAAPPAAAAAPPPRPAQARPAAPAAEPAAPAQAPANPTDVWVNTATKAYHCPGTKYYGTTKHGKYMSEADARAAGYHASYGKACGS